MTPEFESTLTLLLVVIAAGIVLQSVILLVFLVIFGKWCKHTESLIGQMQRNAEPVLDATRELLAESKEKMAVISTNLVEISNLTKTQITHLDELLTDASERARLQLVHLDQLISSTMVRVEETTETVQRSVLAPIRELSAILTGVRTAVDFLFRREKTAVERATQDEELFI